MSIFTIGRYFLEFKKSKTGNYENLEFSLFIAEAKDLIFSFTLAITVCFIICEIPKNMVGKPRPDFFNRCFPCIDLDDHEAVWAKINSLPQKFECEPETCKATEEYCDDYCTNFRGRRSFPSGHAANGWVAFFFLSLWSWGKFKAFVPNTRHQGFRFVPGFLLCGFMYVITFTRVQDNRHDHADCIVGIIFGVFSALLGYFMYFPMLNDGLCDWSNRQLDILEKEDRKV